MTRDLTDAAGAGGKDRSPAPAARDWREFAVCAGIGDWLFFAGQGHEELARRAKAICRGCPVIEPCLEFALEMEAQPDMISRHGTWGGTSPADRAIIARSRRKAAA